MIDTCDEFLLKWSRYHDFIDQEFFYDMDNKSILEIGAFTGAQTQVLYQHNFVNLTIIEPYTNNNLKQKYPKATVITDDIFKVYCKPLPADVVVCLGLLYHLHSPFYLLELIANQSDPQIIILDSVHANCVGQGGLLEEISNVPGNRQSDTKTVSYSIAYTYPDIARGMESLGYKSIRYTELECFPEILQKKSSWMARWEKI